MLLLLQQLCLYELKPVFEGVYSKGIGKKLVNWLFFYIVLGFTRKSMVLSLTLTNYGMFWFHQSYWATCQNLTNNASNDLK